MPKVIVLLRSDLATSLLTVSRYRSIYAVGQIGNSDGCTSKIREIDAFEYKVTLYASSISFFKASSIVKLTNLIKGTLLSLKDKVYL